MRQGSVAAGFHSEKEKRNETLKEETVQWDIAGANMTSSTYKTRLWNVLHHLNKHTRPLYYIGKHI